MHSTEKKNEPANLKNLITDSRDEQSLILKIIFLFYRKNISESNGQWHLNFRVLSFHIFINERTSFNKHVFLPNITSLQNCSAELLLPFHLLIQQHLTVNITETELFLPSPSLSLDSCAVIYLVILLKELRVTQIPLATQPPLSLVQLPCHS